MIAYLAADDPIGLPYLLAPALEAGLLWGFGSVVTTVGIAAFALTVAPLVTPRIPDRRAYASLAAQWLVLALGTGAVAAWVRRVRISAAEPADTSAASYAAAYRLLSQLRVVSRQLSGGLDAYSLGQATLESLRSALPYSRGAVYARSEGGRLIPLAYSGVSRVDWVPRLDDDSVWAFAWTSGLPQRQPGTFSDEPGGYAAVLPLRVGVRVVGLVGVERLEGPFQPDELATAAEVVDEAALRIETALLFSEVRQIATAEERRRLAREIHDGIAQELASLGYVMDDMSYRVADDEQRESMQFLRGELTRIISELRLSIFDLRSEVLASNSLGAALSDHVRTVGATSDLTVHIELDESPQRLRTEAEAELHADRPGGHHQRPQARRRPEPLGHRPDGPAQRAAADRGRRARVGPGTCRQLRHGDHARAGGPARRRLSRCRPGRRGYGRRGRDGDARSPGRAGTDPSATRPDAADRPRRCTCPRRCCSLTTTS